MNILVLNTNILAVNPIDTGVQWETSDQIIPKNVAVGAQIISATLPDDYAPGKYTYAGGVFVAIPPPVPPVQEFTDAVQAHLDNAAAALGYDNIVSACSYAGAANPYQAEGQSFIVWRGNVWTYCYGELAKVQAQTRSVPTVAALIAELPVRA